MGMCVCVGRILESFYTHRSTTWKYTINISVFYRVIQNIQIHGVHHNIVCSVFKVKLFYGKEDIIPLWKLYRFRPLYKVNTMIESTLETFILLLSYFAKDPLFNSSFSYSGFGTDLFNNYNWIVLIHFLSPPLLSHGLHFTVCCTT